MRSSSIKYEIIVKRSNIPEARNLCIDLAVGDVLVFWDSDVVAPINSLRNLVLAVINSRYSIIAADVQRLIFNDVNSAVKFINTTLKTHHTEIRSDNIVPNDIFVGMSFTAIKKEVFSVLRFDEDLTYREDCDYCERAIKKGYKLGILPNVKVYDIDVKDITWSDIYSSMPLSYHFRGITKKARLELYPYKYNLSLRTLINHFIKYPSRALYLSYIFLIISTAYGILSKSIIYVLPLISVIVTYLLYQVILKRRQLTISMKNIVKSIIFGVPYSIILSYFMVKYLIRHYLSRTNMRSNYSKI